MDAPGLTKSERRLILALGEYQDNEDPKNMTEIAAEIDEPIQALQRGKPSAENHGFVESERDHPSTIMKLTDKGEDLYEVLKEYTEIIESEAG